MKSMNFYPMRNGRTVRAHVALFVLAAAPLGPGVTSAVAANSSEHLVRPEKTVAATCQNNLSDHLAVCCAHTRGGKAYFKQLARKDCRRLRGAEVAKSRCPARHGRSDDPKKRLVCCQFDDTPGFGVRAVLLGGKVVWYGLAPAERCTGSNKPVKRSHCVKRTTRRDRMIACMKRGKGWVWNNNRCQREAVRDKRDPRILECRKRGKDWVWRDGKCQRAYVRDKRDR